MQVSTPTPMSFPAPLQCLFVPKRYKVVYGGRGAGRSWGFARALLLMGLQRKLTVLCARELQKSIEDSVHKLLKEQIENSPDSPESPGLGLLGHYDIEQSKIVAPSTGTKFSFEGIKNNVNAIRSYEGVDICWVEEAASVSENSWKVLIPTIRKNGSELWISFNPELEEDYTYKRFVLDPDLRPADGRSRFAIPVECPLKESDRAFVVKMSWKDNPWFPETLRVEMEADKRLDYDKYLHVWEGHCVQNLIGAVYAKELRRATEENRICVVPYEREVPVDTFWDLGRADSTAIWFAQRVGMQWRILRYYEASQELLAHFLKYCQDTGYVFGEFFLPHDAKHKRLGYRHSIEELIGLAGYRVRVLPPYGVTDGINAARGIFHNCWFDEKKCGDGLHALRHYAYAVDVHGKLSDKPLHNWASDGADAFRYFALAARTTRGTSSVSAERTRKRLDDVRSKFEGLAARLSWMG